MGVLGWMGLVTARGLWQFNKFALILSAVVGGVLTPGPDILSQLLMAGPLFGLFNLSIIMVWMIERARRKKLEALAKETGADLVPSDRLTVRRTSVEKNLTSFGARPRWKTTSPCWANFPTLTGYDLLPRASVLGASGSRRGCRGGVAAAAAQPRRGPRLRPDRPPDGEPDPALGARMFTLLKLGVALVALLAFCWFGITHQLGSRTLFEHMHAIGQTKESQELVDGTRQVAGPLVDDVRRRVGGKDEARDKPARWRATRAPHRNG